MMQRQGANKEVVMSECVDHGKTGNAKGYCVMRYKGNNQYAHRVAYCESKGISLEAIRGLLVRHTCDNPRCVNPEHLLLGTHQDNVRDRQARNRQAKGEKQGLAKLTEEDVKFIRENYVRYSKEFGTVALGCKFGVSSPTISKVARGVSWEHVEDLPCTQVNG